MKLNYLRNLLLSKILLYNVLECFNLILDLQIGQVLFSCRHSFKQAL